jgi:hypothetical protein
MKEQWLALLGVADPAYVKFGMAAIAGIALLAAIGVVFGIIGTVLDAMKGCRRSPRRESTG